MLLLLYLTHFLPQFGIFNFEIYTVPAWFNFWKMEVALERGWALVLLGVALGDVFHNRRVRFG
jgi:hypothetical protein